MTLSRAAIPFTVVLFLTRNDVNIIDVCDEVVHVSLFPIFAVVPEAFCNLNVVGQFGVLWVGLCSSIGGGERMGWTKVRKRG